MSLNGADPSSWSSFRCRGLAGSMRLDLWYLRDVFTRVGGWISRNPAAYKYLKTTIEAFPAGPAFMALMENAGFAEVEAHPLTGGIATLYKGVKK